MKNKIILLVLIILFAPLVSHAMIVPMANLTVTVNTQGSDAPFHFNLTNVPSFDLTTSNLSASKSLSFMAYTNYYLSQDAVSGLKIGSIFCTSDNPNDVFWYQPNGVGFSPINKENIVCTFNNARATTPVLIVPGILGSAQENGVWILDPILHAYDNLVDTLKANGYEQDKTLFEFPYDWHKSNVDTATELKNKIASIKAICNCDKVDIIAHSMGGLGVRQYIESSNYQNDVDKLIFLGTPQLGAPKDYLAWEGGIIGKSTQDLLLTFLLTREAEKQGYKDLFTYIRQKPILSVQELLPIYDYLYDYNSSAEKHYPAGYPINTFLENLNSNLPELTSSNISISNIIGNDGDGSTISAIKVVPSDFYPLWQDGYPANFDSSQSDGLVYGLGDDTVPDESSDIFPGTATIDSGHMSLPTNAEQQILNDLLGPGQYNIVNNVSPLNLKLLIIKLLSPVDMQVIAPDGKRIGKDFSSNQDINEIPYAFYSGFQTDDEYVTVLNPEDGQYKIITQGTGSGGEYTIASALISDSQDVKQDFSGHTAPGQIENVDLGLSSENNKISLAPEDITPPQITIVSPQSQDYLHSDNLNINYSAMDDGSGVFSSSAKLDNVDVSNGQNIDLFFQSLGSHNFTVQAQDNANNQSSASAQFRVIATVDSTISDINRAYSLGWIAKKSTRDDLINNINKANKLISKIEYIEQKMACKPKVLQKIEKMEKGLDAILAKAILLDLSVFEKTKIINQQAYDLISADINWIINNN